MQIKLKFLSIDSTQHLYRIGDYIRDGLRKFRVENVVEQRKEQMWKYFKNEHKKNNEQLWIIAPTEIKGCLKFFFQNNRMNYHETNQRL